ncbi:MAG: ABC transporter substrate-binding protein [Methanomicrobiales archaeon]|nr:ABC transporter substrate-binding protein [Methanomicrobiales archaeon]
MVIHANTPVRIGVLLPMTGDVELKEPLEWAREDINRQGGIGGRQVELVYRDTSAGNTTQLAQELLDDNSIRVVIGPPTSDDVYTLAPEFISRQKLLVSPLATSGDIIRAFGKKGYFWRTTQGDVAQVRTIVSLLQKKGVKRVALLAENTTYGDTFYDWTGFFATEYGLNLTFIRHFGPGDRTLVAGVADALATNPDYLIAACGPAGAVTIKQAIDRSGKPVPLFLADAAATPVLVSTLGAAAEGLEGTSPTADPSSGFAAAYQEKFGHAPADYAAPVYDALLLAIYTTARQDSAIFESPADSIRHVVYGNGTPRGWDGTGSIGAVRELRGGGSPAVSGASGPLDYDTEYGVDPLVTYYSHWTVENGSYKTNEILGSAKAGTSVTKGGPVALSRASEHLMTVPAAGSGRYVPVKNRTGFFAVIVGPSKGWQNYRHQSDALAVYTLLRGNGVPDDHIILMLYDDVPYALENPIRGDIHNIPGGINLRPGAGVDYSGSQVSPATLRQVLLGNRTKITPDVLESDNGTDVFVYIASHGSPGSIDFSPHGGAFSADDFTVVTDTMAREGKYRQIVFFVDSCFGESVAMNATARGLLYVTGAAAGEPSLGAVYDMNIKQWLSDEFTMSVLSSIRADPDITFRELYTATYEKVIGSHVRMLNTEHFGSIDMPVREFLKP